MTKIGAMRGIATQTIALIVLAMIAVAILGIMIANYAGKFGEEESRTRVETVCPLKLRSYCNSWHLMGWPDRQDEKEGGTYQTFEDYAPECVEWSQTNRGTVGISKEACKELLGI